MSGAMVDESGIRERWLDVRDELGERARRLWAAAEARSHRWGGIAAVVRATGLSEATVRRGIAELEAGKRVPAGRQRRPGAGRKPILERDPGLDEALEALIDGAVAGDPMSPLRWTSRSVAKLTEQLRAGGHAVAPSTVERRLKARGYSLQSNRKSREGASHPDRDAQFAHIAAVSGAALAAGEPVISVDTKKKELIGGFKNGGREWRPCGEPELVRTHDFKDPTLGKAVPYGIYDVGRDEGWVNVGIDNDTAQFAVSAIAGWWQHLGTAAYPDATTLTITADCGGSNGNRTRLWKTELQALADATGLAIRVLHYPPGTSKWNKIEHRLFSHISINWRAKPLVSRQVVIDLIAATTTTMGLKVYARLDDNAYPKGIKISDRQLATVNLVGDEFHPEWNYRILPSVIKT